MSRLSASVLTLAFVAASTALSAAIPAKMNYQGRLTLPGAGPVADSTGNTLVFRIFDAQTSGTLLWTETWNSGSSCVTTTAGLFSVELGKFTSLSSLAFDVPYFLEIQVNADPSPLSPRQPLAVAPYAFRAGVAEGVSSSAGNFLALVYANNNSSGAKGVYGIAKPNFPGVGVQGEGKTGVLGLANSSNGVGVLADYAGQSGAYALKVSGPARFDTGSVTFAAHVDFSGATVTGLLANVVAPLSLSQAAGGATIYGYNTAGPGVHGASTGGSTSGLYGTSTNATGSGVVGFNSSTTGAGAHGVFGDSASNQGNGIYGQNFSAANTGAGVFGTNSSSIGYGVVAKNTGGGIGLSATATSAAAGYFRNNSSFQTVTIINDNAGSPPLRLNSMNFPPNDTGAAGKFLGSDGAGNLSWNTVGVAAPLSLTLNSAVASPLSVSNATGAAGLFQGLTGVVISASGLALSVTSQNTGGPAVMVRANTNSHLAQFTNDGGGSGLAAYSIGGSGIYAQSSNAHGIQSIAFGSGMAAVYASGSGASAYGVYALNGSGGKALVASGGSFGISSTASTGWAGSFAGVSGVVISAETLGLSLTGKTDNQLASLQGNSSVNLTNINNAGFGAGLGITSQGLALDAVSTAGAGIKGTAGGSGAGVWGIGNSGGGTGVRADNNTGRALVATGGTIGVSATATNALGKAFYGRVTSSFAAAEFINDDATGYPLKVNALNMTGSAGTAGQVLTTNGSNLMSWTNAPAPVAPLSLTNSGLPSTIFANNLGGGRAVEVTNNDGGNETIRAENFAGSGVVIYGVNAAVASVGAGVFGSVPNGAASSMGVYGSNGGSGYGVQGNSANGTGVYGTTNVGPAGVRGDSANGIGVLGQAPIALAGQGVNYGLSATASAVGGTAIRAQAGSGVAGSFTGITGIAATSSSSVGTAIYGANSATTGSGHGVIGTNSSVDGFGVIGRNFANAGANPPAGVGGFAMDHAQGLGGFFIGNAAGVKGQPNAANGVGVMADYDQKPGALGLFVRGPSEFEGLTFTPNIASVGNGRIYFDNVSGKFRKSESGGAYVDLGGSLVAPISLTASSATSTLSAFNNFGGHALYGKASTAGGAGVFGENLVSGSWGVYGKSTGTNAPAVVAESLDLGLSVTASGPTATGIVVQTNTSSYGIDALNNGSGPAVMGRNQSAGGTGVYGQQSWPSNTGAAVYGANFGGANTGKGVYGTNNSSGGVGVYGYNSNGRAMVAEGGSIGLSATSASGTAIYARNGSPSWTGWFINDDPAGSAMRLENPGGGLGLEVVGDSSFQGEAYFSSGNVTFATRVDFSGATVTGLSIAAPLNLTNSTAASTAYLMNNGGGKALAVSNSASSSAIEAWNGSTGNAIYANNNGFGTGIFGDSSSGSQAGVWGRTSNTGGYGVRAQNTALSNGVGLLAEVTGGSGGGTAVKALGQRYGISATASDSPTGIAGYFSSVSAVVAVSNVAWGRAIKATNLDGAAGAVAIEATAVGTSGVGLQAIASSGAGSSKGVIAQGGYIGVSATGGSSGTGAGLYAGGAIAVDADGPVDLRAKTGVAVSGANTGRIYFDDTTNKFKVSEDGNGYLDLLPAAGTYVSTAGDTMSGGLTINGASFGLSATSTTNPAGQFYNSAGSGYAIKADSSGAGAIGLDVRALGSGGWGAIIQGAGLGLSVTASGGAAVGIYAAGSTSSQVIQAVNNSSGHGIAGVNNSTGGAGVYGQNNTNANFGSGVYGANLGTSNTGDGVYGTNNSGSGNGVSGENTATTGSAIGVYGSSASTSGYGVYGGNNTAGNNGAGVYGSNGSTGGYGVYGYAGAATGSPTGVFGTTAAADGRGVTGQSTGASNTGIGVSGVNNSGTGYGVWGTNSGTTGNAIGVRGDSSSTGAAMGVYGTATGANNTGDAVRGYNTSGTGFAVRGQNGSATGVGVGVFGQAGSSTSAVAVVGSDSSSPVYPGSRVGVYGYQSAAGTGVHGRSVSGIGVVAEGATVGLSATATGAAGPVVGVHGEAFGASTQRFGVVGRVGTSGFQTVAGGVGVLGENGNGTGYGILARNYGAGGIALVAGANAQAISATTISTSTGAIYAGGATTEGVIRGDNDGSGPGVFGYGTGAGAGVQGQVAAGTSGGSGVLGIGSVAGVGGVRGSSGHASGWGVVANNTAGTGAAVALSASAASATGVAGYFKAANAVVAEGSAVGVSATTTGTTATDYAIFARSNAPAPVIRGQADNASSSGVQGIGFNTGKGVVGSVASPGGASAGVEGSNTGSTGYGVSAVNTAATGGTTGAALRVQGSIKVNFGSATFSGTTATLDAVAGSVGFSSGGSWTTLTVNNNYVTANSVVIVTFSHSTYASTGMAVLIPIAGGSFTVNSAVAQSYGTSSKLNFVVIN